MSQTHTVDKVNMQSRPGSPAQRGRYSGKSVDHTAEDVGLMSDIPKNSQKRMPLGRWLQRSRAQQRTDSNLQSSMQVLEETVTRVANQLSTKARIQHLVDQLPQGGFRGRVVIDTEASAAMQEPRTRSGDRVFVGHHCTTAEEASQSAAACALNTADFHMLLDSMSRSVPNMLLTHQDLRSSASQADGIIAQLLSEGSDNLTDSGANVNVSIPDGMKSPPGNQVVDPKILGQALTPAFAKSTYMKAAAAKSGDIAKAIPTQGQSANGLTSRSGAMGYPVSGTNIPQPPHPVMPRPVPQPGHPLVSLGPVPVPQQTAAAAAFAPSPTSSGSNLIGSRMPPGPPPPGPPPPGPPPPGPPPPGPPPPGPPPPGIPPVGVVSTTAGSAMGHGTISSAPMSLGTSPPSALPPNAPGGTLSHAAQPLPNVSVCPHAVRGLPPSGAPRAKGYTGPSMPGNSMHVPADAVSGVGLGGSLFVGEKRPPGDMDQNPDDGSYNSMAKKSKALGAAGQNLGPAQARLWAGRTDAQAESQHAMTAIPSAKVPYHVGHKFPGNGATMQEESFVVDNSLLPEKFSGAEGIGFRDAPQFEEKEQGMLKRRPTAPWGATVTGIIYNNDWLQVGERFLPMHVNGVPVLRRLEAPLVPVEPPRSDSLQQDFQSNSGLMPPPGYHGAPWTDVSNYDSAPPGDVRVADADVDCDEHGKGKGLGRGKNHPSAPWNAARAALPSQIPGQWGQTAEQAPHTRPVFKAPGTVPVSEVEDVEYGKGVQGVHPWNQDRAAHSTATYEAHYKPTAFNQRSLPEPVGQTSESGPSQRCEEVGVARLNPQTIAKWPTTDGHLQQAAANHQQLPVPERRDSQASSSALFRAPETPFEIQQLAPETPGARSLSATGHMEKLALVLDVDNTLVHTVKKTSFPCQLDVSHFKNEKGERELFEWSPGHPNDPRACYVKLRPGVLAFLEELAPICEMSVVSTADKDYLDFVLRLFDPKHVLFPPERVAARGDLDLLPGDPSQRRMKHLRMVKHSLDRVLVFDDRLDVWHDELQRKHHNFAVIRAYAYDFLNKHRDDVLRALVHRQPLESLPRDRDMHLPCAAKLIKKVHAEFVAAHTTGATVKPVLGFFFKQMLQGVRMHVIEPDEQPGGKSGQVCQAAESFGAIIEKDLNSSVHIVVCDSARDPRFARARGLGLPVVHGLWLTFCLATFSLQDPTPFRVEAEYLASSLKPCVWQAHHTYNQISSACGTKDPSTNEGRHILERFEKMRRRRVQKQPAVRDVPLLVSAPVSAGLPNVAPAEAKVSMQTSLQPSGGGPDDDEEESWGSSITWNTGTVGVIDLG